MQGTHVGASAADGAQNIQYPSGMRFGAMTAGWADTQVRPYLDIGYSVLDIGYSSSSVPLQELEHFAVELVAVEVFVGDIGAVGVHDAE